MPQYEVELILARQLAGGLAVPVLLVDSRGDTVFFNEPAAVVFGRRFEEVDGPGSHVMTFSQWMSFTSAVMSQQMT